jgi:hypothetical protein
MIVLKATQDKFLGVLQSYAGIVERRHTPPILDKVLIRKTDTNLAPSKACASSAYQPKETKAFRNRAMSLATCSGGFFSSSKANLRNAP